MLIGNFPNTPGNTPASGIPRDLEMWEHLGSLQHGKQHIRSIKRSLFTRHKDITRRSYLKLLMIITFLKSYDHL